MILKSVQTKLSVSVFVFVCFLNFNSLAQSTTQVLEMVNKVKSDAHNFRYEIPFEYRNNQIVIQIGIGNKQYDYIFDTGGYNNVTPVIQQLNQFPLLTSQTVGSANKMKRKVDIVMVDTVSIGGLIFSDVAMLKMDYSNLPTFRCAIDGALIGASIIKKYIWQIDYPNKKIIVTDKLESLSDMDKAVKIPVTFNSRLMPFIDLQIDGHSEKLMFDLGSSSPFSMTKKSALMYGRLNKAITIIGAGTEGGNGIVKQDVKVFRAGVVKIGPLSLLDKPVLYAATNNENLIGNPIIKDYVVTLNFSADEMYFASIKDVIETGWSSFGFSAIAEKGHILVGTLYIGLAGERQGLKLNDEIVAIDGKPITCNDLCVCIKLAKEMLIGRESISLTVVRNGERKNMVINKEKVFMVRK